MKNKISPNTPFLGYQTLVELYNCNNKIIDSAQIVEDILLRLTSIVELTVVNSIIHHFSPIGVSGVIVIEESHLAIHTWPEHNYVAIDFFTCNKKYDIEKGIEFLIQKFEASHFELKDIKRGSMNIIENLIKDYK